MNHLMTFESLMNRAYGGITVVIGGLYYATPSWMKRKWSDAGLPLGSNVKFIAHSDSLEPLKSKHNISKIMGFSKGGQTIWREIEMNPDEYDFIGLIDPTTSRTFYELPENVYSLTNSNNWGAYPRIQTHMRNMERSGILTRTNLPHERIPLEFFKRYESELA